MNPNRHKWGSQDLTGNKNNRRLASLDSVTGFAVVVSDDENADGVT